MEMEIIELLENNIDKDGINKVLDLVKSKPDDIIIKKVVLEKEHAYRVYKDRFLIQKTITKSNILGYEKLLSNIQKMDSLHVIIYIIMFKEKFYGIFFSENNVFLGLLYSLEE